MYNEIKNIYVPTVYFDMDGVLADFERASIERGMVGSELKLVRNLYLELEPYPGAFDALKEIADMGFNTHIATKIPTHNPYAATEKLLWLEKYLPHMLPHTTITPNKGQLGTKDDFLIDDRIHKANVMDFNGTVLHFGPYGKYKDWEQTLDFFRKFIEEKRKGS